MATYQKLIEIRWSDLDPNYHVKHSAYYDYGAYCRIAYLNEQGVTPALMTEHHLGPILLREECFFKREIRFGDELLITLKLSKAKEDMSRWTMVHQIFKQGNALAASIIVDGAWMDTSIRKLARPPQFVKTAMEQLPRLPGFEFT